MQYRSDCAGRTHIFKSRPCIGEKYLRSPVLARTIVRKSLDNSESLCYSRASHIAIQGVGFGLKEGLKRVETSISSQGAGVGSEVLEARSCRHQWLIDSPAGPSSGGVCRLCGEERQFQNYIEGTSWGYDISLEQLADGSRIPNARNMQGNKGIDEE